MIVLACFADAFFSSSSIPTVGFNMKKVQKGHVTLKWYDVPGMLFAIDDSACTNADHCLAGIWVASRGFDPCGRDIVAVLMLSCRLRAVLMT